MFTDICKLFNKQRIVVQFQIFKSFRKISFTSIVILFPQQTISKSQGDGKPCILLLRRYQSPI